MLEADPTSGKGTAVPELLPELPGQAEPRAALCRAVPFVPSTVLSCLKKEAFSPGSLCKGTAIRCSDRGEAGSTEGGGSRHPQRGPRADGAGS